jgi:dsRNA-specific ribonuclease
LKVHLHNFSKKKSQKEVTKQWESRFFLLFFDDIYVQGSPVFRGLGSSKEEAKNRAAEQMLHGLYLWGLQGGTVPTYITVQRF